jgi:dTDP-glucose pyrophosphorylase
MTIERVIPSHYTLKDSLRVLNDIGVLNNVLFIVNEENQLLGSLTDGDIRRGFLNDLDVNSLAILAANNDFRYIQKGNKEAESISLYKKQGIRFVPLLNEDKRLLQILDLHQFNGFLPVSTVLMAGGKGQRLMPLTKDTPKPMLKIGEKPIIEYNIDRLIRFGVEDIHISVNYLSHIIMDYFKDGSSKNVSIKYIKEDKPLGTIGSLTLAKEYKNDYILLMNSDLLTNINFEDFFNEFIAADADMAVAAVPYYVDIPYAVLETGAEDRVLSLKEKPRYIYYSNAGIYLLKKELLAEIPLDEMYNATDLMELVINTDKKLINYPILGYWLDIGKMPDYLKAQEDIKHIVL